MPADAEPRPRWRRIIGSTWFHLATAFVVTGLILTFVAKPYWVPSSSMEETLQPGDRILVNRLAFIGTQPGTGDIIVFDANEAWEPATTIQVNPLVAGLRWVGEITGFGPSSSHTLVKRVIGASGQAVECCTDAGALTIDGSPLEEPYVTNDFPFVAGSLDCDSTPRSQRCFEAVTVPDDSYLVLGDNRAASADSAVGCRTRDATEDCWRWASRNAIVGKGSLVLWPVGRWAGL